MTEGRMPYAKKLRSYFEGLKRRMKQRRVCVQIADKHGSLKTSAVGFFDV